MKSQTVITWNQARAQAERSKERQRKQAKQKLDEFLESSLELMDARDMGYYAELTGKTPNELRRLHPENNIGAMMGTYDLSNDDILSIF